MNNGSRHETTTVTASPSRRPVTNKQLFDTFRGPLLHDLVSEVDRLIYAEICIIYFLEYLTNMQL